MVLPKRLAALFTELRALTSDLPKAPSEWEDDGEHGEIRENNGQSFVCIQMQSGRTFWEYVDSDPEAIRTRQNERVRLNKEIAKLLATFDPRRVDNSKESLDEAYGILGAISEGLGHGEPGVASADLLLQYLDTVSEFTAYWADVFVRACLGLGDFEAAHNLIQSFLEQAGSPMRHQASMHSTRLRGTVYIGKAFLCVSHTKDAEQAKLWSDRAKNTCAGVPGVVEAAKKIGKVAREVMKLCATMDEEDAFDQVFKDARLNGNPQVLLESA